MGEVILDVKGLKKYFPIAKGDSRLNSSAVGAVSTMLPAYMT